MVDLDSLPDDEEHEREVLQQWEKLKTFWREFVHSKREGWFPDEDYEYCTGTLVDRKAHLDIPVTNY